MRGFAWVLGVALIALGSQSGCGGSSSGSETVDEVDPSDATAVMQALLVKVAGADGVLQDGDLPTPSTDAAAPKVEIETPTLTAANGATAQIPLSFDASSPIASIFMKVANAPTFFEISVASPAGQKLMQQQTQAKATASAKLDPGARPNFEMTLPPRIRNGQFMIQISCKDNAGLFSEIKTAMVNVAQVGTGELQFSLTWDSTADIDLHVFEPSGFEIFFGDDLSPSGGMLDFDDTDGTGTGQIGPDGQNALENIFWSSGAPRGRYRVEVDYFSGSVATNFTVTASANGRVVASESVTGFVLEDGQIEVLTLDF